jgi:ADP-heptose:LPS heptosyltransferase
VGSILENLPREGRAAIIRLRSLGDCVLTTPALDILKRARPDLRVAVMVEDRFRDIFEGNPDVEEILPPRLAALRRWRPALCLNFHGGPRSAWMTALSCARYRAGFGHYRRRWAYNVHIPRAQEILGAERKVHTAEHLASAMFYLGAERVEIPGAKLVIQDGRQKRLPHCCAIHPVAATAEKTWRADGFLAVAERLKSCGMETVFIGAAGDDLSPFRAYRTVAGAPLSEIKALLAGAALFVGNDSGPAHMAAAFGVPSVVVFGPSDPAIWGPWRTASEVVRSPAGIGGVEIGQVLDALTRLKVAA